MAVVGGAVLVFFQAEPGACDLGYRPSLADASTDRTVVAAAERQVIAASPFPWGTSAAVVTRVWGGRQVERWHISERQWKDCTFDIAQPVGDLAYDFEVRGGMTPNYLKWIGRTEPIGVDQSDQWITEFGGVVVYEIGLPDRLLAWVRVFPELLFLVPALFLIWWVRRAERRPD